MLKVIDYTKTYAGREILRIDALAIPEGIHWIKGANGSGKSTFFRSVAGIIPFEGQISWRNTDLKKQPIAYRMKVNMSEAEPLYPEFLSGYDILKFISEAKKGDWSSLEERASRLGVPAYWKKPCGTYSSGMLKKVAVMAAFAGNPELIILDEPLITLDSASIGMICDMVRELHQNKGVSFLFSSHQDMALEALSVQQMYTVSNQSMHAL